MSDNYTNFKSYYESKNPHHIIDGGWGGWGPTIWYIIDGSKDVIQVPSMFWSTYPVKIEQVWRDSLQRWVPPEPSDYVFAEKLIQMGAANYANRHFVKERKPRWSKNEN